jgi:hypothetical protein
MTLWQKIKEVLFGEPLDSQFEKILKQEEKDAYRATSSLAKPLDYGEEYKGPATPKKSDPVAPVTGGAKTKGAKKPK